MSFAPSVFRSAVILTLAGVASTFALAVASAEDQALVLNAKRAETTLPSSPAVGDTYIVDEDLTDDSGNAKGTAQSSCEVTGLSDADPPQAYTNCTVTLQLDEGDLFLICHIKRTLDSPEGHPCGVVGGTEAYRLSRGDGTISFPSEDKVVFKVKVSTT